MNDAFETRAMRRDPVSHTSYMYSTWSILTRVYVALSVSDMLSMENNRVLQWCSGHLPHRAFASSHACNLRLYDNHLLLRDSSPQQANTTSHDGQRYVSCSARMRSSANVSQAPISCTYVANPRNPQRSPH